MFERTLRDWLGISLVVSHAVIATVTFGIAQVGVILIDEFFDILLIVGPTFGAYVTAVVTYFTDNRHRRILGKKLTFPFVFIAFFFPSFYVLSVIAVVVLRALGFLDFSTLKGLFGAIETMFAIYAARIIHTLFAPSGTN